MPLQSVIASRILPILGVEALIQFGAEAVKSAKEGVREGVAQIKESVSSFSETDSVGHKTAN